MTDDVVETEWLDAVTGKDFFYPAAFLDIPDFVRLLTPQVTRFVCNDLAYHTAHDRQSPVPAGAFHYWIRLCLIDACATKK